MAAAELGEGVGVRSIGDEFFAVASGADGDAVMDVTGADRLIGAIAFAAGFLFGIVAVVDKILI